MLAASGGGVVVCTAREAGAQEQTLRGVAVRLLSDAPDEDDRVVQRDDLFGV
jgi:hypothetical protein